MDNDVMRMANHYSFDLQMTLYEQWKLSRYYIKYMNIRLLYMYVKNF